MYEIGEIKGDKAGEAQLWVERENMIHTMNIPGAYSPLYYNDKGEGLIVTGVGVSNAAASLMAIGLNPNINLHHTYFIIAGIAGTSPNVCTIGSAAWAEWVVDGDLCHEIDGREISSNWNFSRFHLGCNEPWCKGFKIGTEVFHLNSILTEWSYKLSKNVKLFDSKEAQEFRNTFPKNLPARQVPFVTKGDDISGSTYWQGKLASEWASWWVKQWTNNAGTYYMTNMEDSGTLTALKRLSDCDRISFDRIMVLRTASDFDQQSVNQSAQQSIHQNNSGFSLSIENAYRVGSTVTHYIINNWNEWKNGIPELK